MLTDASEYKDTRKLSEKLLMTNRAFANLEAKSRELLVKADQGDSTVGIVQPSIRQGTGEGSRIGGEVIGPGWSCDDSDS
ncbi:hypothetical protein BaRGS_00029407 [Batillaria attramentaria]|uniref:Uncharacterized protein n=1 Tax=Batillaria attramentaria TaxID=370345 RepID=A0ABD0JW63_9CAEN